MIETKKKLTALKDLIEIIKDEKIIARVEDAITQMSMDGCFGTEGSIDPRGDQRNAEFIPYDVNDEDSDGEFNYFSVHDVSTCSNALNKLIVDADDDYSESDYEAVEEYFGPLFKECGL